MDFSETNFVNAPRCVIGVDPGLSGACFKIGRGIFTGWRDWKTLTEIATSIRNLCETDPKPDFAVLELVHAMPKQGVCSMFSFGEASGVAKVSLSLFVPKTSSCIVVAPQRWQGFFRETLKILQKQEFDSKAIARQIFPTYLEFFNRAKDHNSADAVLMAVWGLFQITS